MEFFFTKKTEIKIMLLVISQNPLKHKMLAILPVESVANAGVSDTLTAALLMEPAVAGGPHRLARLLTFP